jgi:hypothetical protein
MGVLLLESLTQNHQACGAFTEQAQTDREGFFIQGRYRRSIGLNAGPVGIRIL